MCICNVCASRRALQKLQGCFHTQGPTNVSNIDLSIVLCSQLFAAAESYNRALQKLPNVYFKMCLPPQGPAQIENNSFRVCFMPAGPLEYCMTWIPKCAFITQGCTADHIEKINARKALQKLQDVNSLKMFPPTRLYTNWKHLFFICFLARKAPLKMPNVYFQTWCRPQGPTQIDTSTFHVLFLPAWPCKKL